MRFSLRTLFGLVACSALVTAYLLFLVPSRAGYDRGVAEAKQQIRRGYVTIYISNMADPESSYDASVGLPLEQIASGPVYTEIDERIQGHNDFISRWMENGNIPPNSLANYSTLIAAPLQNLDTSTFVELPNRTTIKLGALRVVYSRDVTLGVRTHRIGVRGPTTSWEHVEFVEKADPFSAALVADGKILVVRYVSPDQSGQGTQSYERMYLLDSYSGICLTSLIRVNPQEQPAAGETPSPVVLGEAGTRPVEEQSP